MTHVSISIYISTLTELSTSTNWSPPHQSSQYGSNSYHPTNDIKPLFTTTFSLNLSSIPQIEYSPTVNQQSKFSQLDSDTLPAITTINLLRNSSNHKGNKPHYDGKILLPESNVGTYSEIELPVIANHSLSVNDTLTVELERYKEQVKVLNKGQNVDLKNNDNVSNSCAQSVEIDLLKQTLSKHLKEKESLMRTVTLLKNDFKKKES
ncbi:hypothetical protein Tco_0665276 [Tanacetum coccineum]